MLVQNCKIYNDASCDISADGQLLAAFIPSSQRGFPDEGILAVYSLAPHNLGEMLYTKRFGKRWEAQHSDTWYFSLAFPGEAPLRWGWWSHAAPASQAQVRGRCSVLAGSIAGESQNESPSHHHGITGILPLWGARVGEELCSQSWLGEVGTLTRCKPVWHCVDLCTSVFTAMLFVTEKNVKFWRVA